MATIRLALPSIPLSFSLATILPPKPKHSLISLWGAEGVLANVLKEDESQILLWPSSPLFDYLQSLVGIVYSWDYDGIWSSSIPQLSFLINENILVECFRFSLSWIGHRISPLAIKYKPPQLFLLITIFIIMRNWF